MVLRIKLAVTVAAIGALFGAAVIPATGQVPGAPAQVVAYEPPTRIERYEMTAFGRSPSARDDETRKVKFLVAERTGNCCENYLTASSRGRLFDIGGRYINFTDDSGTSWESVQPQAPLVNGEGTITMGLGGDVLGIQWDPYSGDHLQSYKYDAVGESWQYLESPLHTPFYDRPWLSVVPGEFTDPLNGEVDYVAFVDGYPHTGTLLYSTDGLTYARASSPFVDEGQEDAVTSWIPTKKSPELDWIQPNSNSPIIPLGGGRALAPPAAFGGGQWSILNPETLRWAPFTLPNGGLNGRYLVDSKGRIHNLLNATEGFEYRISTNGGRSWSSTHVPLPEGSASTGGLQYDFRVNGKLGIAAVGLHVQNGATNSDNDLLYRIDVSGNKPRAVALYRIGLGDVNASSSGPPNDIRFDFATVVILPNGKLATSFLDTTTAGVYHLAEPAIERMGPALAIEL